MNFLRKLYGSVGLAVLLTVFWLCIPVAFVVVVSGVGDEWSDVQWFLLFVATAAVTALIIFTKATREERSEQRAARRHTEEQERVAAVPPAVRLKTARTNLELAEAARQQTAFAHYHLRLQYELPSEPMSYQRADEFLREARQWIDEAVEDIQQEATALGATAAESRAVSFSRAEAASSEAVQEAIVKAREALSELSSSIGFSFAINAAEDALASAQSWAADAFPNDPAQDEEKRESRRQVVAQTQEELERENQADLRDGDLNLAPYSARPSHMANWTEDVWGNFQKAQRFGSSAVSAPDFRPDKWEKPVDGCTVCVRCGKRLRNRADYRRRHDAEHAAE